VSPLESVSEWVSVLVEQTDVGSDLRLAPESEWKLAIRIFPRPGVAWGGPVEDSVAALPLSLAFLLPVPSLMGPLAGFRAVPLE
jgi:hypothetical protein